MSIDLAIQVGFRKKVPCLTRCSVRSGGNVDKAFNGNRRHYWLFGPILILSLGTTLPGCKSFPLRTAYDYQGHYLAVHKDGAGIQTPSYEAASTKPSNPLETDDDNILATPQDLERQLQNTIIDRITAYASALPTTHDPACDGRLHLLIIVHGGMNDYGDSGKHVTDLLPSPISPPIRPVETYPSGGLLNNTCYYPLFLNWNSAFGDSMKDDLTRFRFGEHDKWFARSTAPIIAIGRVLSSAMDIPASLFHQGVTIKDGIVGAIHEGDPKGGIAIDTLANLPSYFLSMTLLPITEGFGAPAWGIMKRRVDEATGSVAPAQDTRSTGAARTLIQTLRKSIVMRASCSTTQLTGASDQKFCWANTSTEVTVTVVGHSMGAMVVNRLLQAIEDPWPSSSSQGLPIEHIVYLAPACSINEAEQLLMPYLDRHTSTHFWLFTLNKRDESREIPFNGLAVFVPRGTLLAWVDTFLENEVGPGEGRFGWVKYLETFYGISDQKPSPRAFLDYFTPASAPWKTLHVNWSLKNSPMRLHAFSSQRRVRDHTAPEHHEDFLEPDHFKAILCKVDSGMFTPGNNCQASK